MGEVVVTANHHHEHVHLADQWRVPSSKIGHRVASCRACTFCKHHNSTDLDRRNRVQLAWGPTNARALVQDIEDGGVFQPTLMRPHLLRRHGTTFCARIVFFSVCIGYPSVLQATFRQCPGNTQETKHPATQFQRNLNASESKFVL